MIPGREQPSGRESPRDSPLENGPSSIGSTNDDDLPKLGPSIKVMVVSRREPNGARRFAVRRSRWLRPGVRISEDATASNGRDHCRLEIAGDRVQLGARRGPSMHESPIGEGSELRCPPRSLAVSMPEMACAGEDHREPGGIRGRDHLRVALRPPWLDNRRGAGLRRGREPIGERKKRVRSDDRTLG